MVRRYKNMGSDPGTYIPDENEVNRVLGVLQQKNESATTADALRTISERNEALKRREAARTRRLEEPLTKQKLRNEQRSGKAYELQVRTGYIKQGMELSKIIMPMIIGLVVFLIILGPGISIIITIFQGMGIWLWLGALAAIIFIWGTHKWETIINQRLQSL